MEKRSFRPAGTHFLDKKSGNEATYYVETRLNLLHILGRKEVKMSKQLFEQWRNTSEEIAALGLEWQV